MRTAETSVAAPSLRRRCCGALLALAAFLAGPAAAAPQFSGLTQLGNAAVAGDNVPTAISGFEVLLMQRGELLYHQSFGNWVQGTRANLDSSTKTVSGALMMSVAETHSNFQLDTRLSSLLPSFQAAVLKRDITVGQAFSHSSGLPGVDVGSPILSNPNITLQQAAALVAQQPMQSTPGSTFSYGGLSMHAAGAAAEMATGESFRALMQTRILDKLGMAETTWVLPSPASNNPRVSGGLESTASDFARFMDMLLNDGVDRVDGDRVLSAASVAQMLTRQTSDSQAIANSPLGNNRYGIGVWLDQLESVTDDGVDALAAGARGFHGWIDRDNDLVLVFATDLTTWRNVSGLAALMHDSVLAALAVPEPGTVLLALVAGLALCVSVRRGPVAQIRGSDQRL